MPVVPFSTKLQQNYRDSVDVVNSPSTIDTDKEVSPVVVIGDGVAINGIKEGIYGYFNVSTVTGTGTTTITTVVPTGEKWKMISAIIQTANAGSATIGGLGVETKIAILPKNVTASQDILISSTSSAGVSQVPILAQNFPPDFVLLEGTLITIQFTCSVFASNKVVNTKFCYNLVR